MFSKKQKIIYSILIIFVVVVYVYSNYIIDFNKDKEVNEITTSTPNSTNETKVIETIEPTKQATSDKWKDEMDMSIKGHTNYNVPVTIKADKCSLIYKMVNPKLEDDKLSFEVNIENNKNVARVIVRARDEMNKLLDIEVEDNSNKLNCVVNNVKSDDVFLRFHILTKEQYADYLAKKSNLEDYKFGVGSFNIEMVRRMGE